MVLSIERWRGKVAVVTGAGSGIGAAISIKLVEEGLQVVGFDINPENVEKLSKTLQGKKGKLHSFKVNVSQEEDVIKGFKWVSDNLGLIHILINCAGTLFYNNLVDGKTEEWRKLFETNVLGLCITTREAVKVMRSNNIDGHIVHINSYAGHVVTNVPALNVYPASKFAVTALTETLRQEFNHLGVKIKITSVSPGAVETNIFGAFLQDTNLAELMKKLPKLQAEDIADAIIYVLSTPPHVQVHELTVKPVGEPY